MSCCRRSLFRSLAVVLAVAGRLIGQSDAPAVSDRPRLVVLCSVDQLAQWVYAQGAQHLAADGGFRRLERQGVTFTECAFEHACTETGPGHATIGTGAPASRHGIVKNQWWSLTDKKTVYCAADVAAALPGLDEGADRGAGKLRVPTLASSLKAHVAGSKVASIAWKDRSAILVVGADADVAAWFETRRGMLTTNTQWVETAPAWLTAFNDSRAIDQFFGQQWELVGPPSAYAGLVDDQPFEWMHQNGSRTRTLPQALTGGKDEPEKAYYTQLYASPFGNTVVRLAAEAAVRGMQLGQDDVPDLLCVSFSSTDLVGHYFGPESVEARDTLLRLDHDLGAFFRTLDAEVGAGRWAIFLTSDHGVSPTPEAARQNGVAASRGPIDAWVKSAVEKGLRDVFGQPPEGMRYTAHVGEGAVYLDDATILAAGLVAARDTMARTAADAAGSVKGIMAAYATHEIVGDGSANDPIRRALANAIAPGRAGDVQLVIQPYWLNGGLPASHGTPHSYDREVIGFAMGPGLPAGERVATPITPGFGVVLFAQMLGIPKPTAAYEVVPAGLLGGR